MTEWCTAHPWMTFFVAITLASSIGTMFRVVVHRSRNEDD